MTETQYIVSPYAIAQFATAVVSVIVSIHIYRRRESRGGLPLFLLFMAISFWAMANSLEAAAVPQNLKIFWSKAAYIGAHTAPVFLLLMAAEYTNYSKRITPLATGLLFLIPVIIILLAATNEFHHLIWTGFEQGPPGTNSIIYLHGKGYWAAVAFVFTCCSLATALLIFSVTGSQGIYRKQSLYFLAASLFPWLGAALYILDINPFPGLDTISISFLFTGLLILFAMRNQKLMDMVPISHELIFGHIDDAVLVIDSKYRIMDINSAADSLLGIDRKDDLGKQAGDVLDFWEVIASDILEGESSRHEITIQDTNKTLDVKISPLMDRGTKFLGWGLILSDVTVMKRIETELQKTNLHLKQRIAENKKLQAQLREQAIRDPLTGTYNRGYFDETLTRDLARAVRENTPLSILMLDVDSLKGINDNFGHKMGDKVIFSIGQLLKKQTRKGDCVCRYGGDEFVILMPGMIQADAFQRAELWREGLKGMVFQKEEKIISVTVSIGVATYPLNGNSGDELLDKVDQAMYKAKQAGRDQTRVADKGCPA